MGKTKNTCFEKTAHILTVVDLQVYIRDHNFMALK